jgi:hypothetical protein
VSYGTGAETLLEHGYHDLVDMKLSGDEPILDMIIPFSRVLRDMRPQLVVAHEEFGALAAAAIIDTPALFITDFFFDPLVSSMQMLRHAEETIFVGEPGIFTEPPYLKATVRYVGPAVRRFEYKRCDRDRARTELGLPLDGTVIACLPGSWREGETPIADVVIGAFIALPIARKRLVWVAGRDLEVLSAKFGGSHDVTFVKADWQIDRLIVASDLVISKATRSTLWEVSSLGVPSISLSHGANYPDDVVASRIASNTLLEANKLDCGTLVRSISEKLDGAKPEIPNYSDGVLGAASRIAYHLDRVRGFNRRP